MYTPCKPQFYHIKVGFKGIKIIQDCFLDADFFSYFSMKAYAKALLMKPQNIYFLEDIRKMLCGIMDKYLEEGLNKNEYFYQSTFSR